MGALDSWTEPAATKMSWAGPAEELESTCEESAPEGAGEEQAPEGAGKEQAPEGAGEEQALERAGEETPIWMEPVEVREILGLGSNSSPHMSPTSPGAHEHREVGLRWLADLREPRTAADFPRTAGLREPRMAADFPRTAGLREPRMAADFPRTPGWASRGRRRRTPANGRPRSAAGGGVAPPSFF